MKYYLAALVISSLLVGCGSGDAKLTAKSSSSTVLVIPAAAVSCKTYLTTTDGSLPTADVSSSYFRIPRITFTKSNKANDMYIAVIKVSFQVPGEATPHDCTYGGDDLAALYYQPATGGALTPTPWWSSPTHEALIPAGTATLTTNCPMYCGGIDVKSSFSSTATMEIVGYEQAPGSELQEPVKITTTFQIQNPL